MGRVVSIVLRVGGRSLERTLDEWCAHFGVTRSTVAYRRAHGRTWQQAFEEPLEERGQRGGRVRQRRRGARS